MASTQKFNEQQTISCTLERMIYYNNQNGYCIALFHSGKETLTAVGYLPNPNDGDEYALTGRWTTHAKYGKQFAFESFETHLPTTMFGVEQFLASGLIKGIGPSLASKIIEHFGSKTIDILNNSPDRLLEVEGIGRKKYAGILSALTSLKEMQETMLFLKSHAISTAYAIRLYKTYGSAVKGVLEHNPYQIIDDVYGIGFRTADEIAQKMGVEQESIYRLTAGVRFVLDDACRAGGHCFLPKEETLQRASSLLVVDEAKVERALDEGVRQGYIVDQNGDLFPLLMHNAEYRSATKLSLLMKKGERNLSKEKILSSVSFLEKTKKINFDAKQRDAILHAILHPVTIITGGPGTGKTLCVNGIIEIADQLDMSYMLCAPTGRAAKRLAEVSGRESKTIHRLLEFDPAHGGFRRGEENVLECDLLIVDEVSMVDIQLFDALLNAVSPQSQIVFVGDVDQLPSVGPGQVLRDLIESKRIFTVRLDTIFRQSEESSIILNSHRINHGEPPDFADDFQLIDEETPEAIKSRIVGLCSTILPQNYRYDIFNDVQVLSPMNNTVCGVKELNKELQRVLNGHSKVCWQGSEKKFLLNDKVMQIRNNYDKDVFNGDVGRIVGVDKEEGILIVNFYGKKIDYTFEEAEELVLAYATTIHKSQGNEFKVVILPMTLAHYIMLQRNLLYTAVTRAKELLILVGQKKALGMAMKNVDVRERNTFLRQRLQELI
jgi:exodeoxyribonuclease V alpha subunit